ncbi:FxLYD domain-containing protein [Asanoa hainanensis]|uniref:FxLYD domain-containing protein n=1 Tax=Asanoa hainanensis TaxID=560556 RepID=UPI0011804799|nr:FxLYD domain-containing protein [Asanoa hainanensis]
MTIVVVLAMAAVSVWAGAKQSRARAAEMLVDVVSCDYAGDKVTVELSVKNTGATARSAHIEVEYLDEDGNRIDRASVTARDVAPGDTASLQENTQLDAPATTGTCRVAAVR